MDFSTKIFTRFVDIPKLFLIHSTLSHYTFFILFSNWQYYINLAGNQFPLYNLDDFAAKLKKKNIPYSINSYIPPKNVNRWTYFYEEAMADNSKYLLPPVPFNLTLFKGMREVVLSRNYSRFCLEHPVARSFRTWIKNTAIPDESYFQTLSRISDIVVQDNDSAEILNVTQNFDTDWDTTVHGICLRYTKWAISPGGISD